MTIAARRPVIPVIVAGVLFAGVGGAQPRGRRTEGPSSFSYYLLTLSYAPSFCSQPMSRKDPRECGVGRNVGFVVHGLWPQGETTRGPENCGPASPVAQRIVQAMLPYFPSESLIQHEWRAHGTCSGMSADDYFAALRKARDRVNVPSSLTPSTAARLSPADIESALAAANPGFPKEAFRTSCYRDGQLQEIRICFDRELSPRACGPSAGECRFAAVSLPPVR